MKEIKIGKIDKWEKESNKGALRDIVKKAIQEEFKDSNKVIMIPAKNNQSEYKQIRVAAYCRVSTKEEQQVISFELQKQWYQQLAEKNSDWDLVGIYADEGISGTSIKKRIGFQQMIADAKNGKIDLIITKNVGRFSRDGNVTITVTRELKTLNPPVGVYFETEKLNTLDQQTELNLSMYSFVAQAESENKREAILWSILSRFSNNRPLFPHNLLGYTINPNPLDKKNRILIDEKAAKVIRYIYDCCIYGMSDRDIANTLTEQKIPTPANKSVWSSSTVRSILKNEKYCGNSLMQKTFTVDCFSHKSKKNRGEKQQFFKENTHPAIISQDKWNIVEKMLKNRRTSIYTQNNNKPIRIKSGKLKGYIILQPKLNNEIIREIARKPKEG